LLYFFSQIFISQIFDVKILAKISPEVAKLVEFTVEKVWKNFPVFLSTNLLKKNH
jgi:hypothetical protein